MGKRLFFITDYAPPYIGGMETHAEEFVRFFSRDKINPLAEIFLFAPRAGSAVEARTRLESQGSTPIEVLSERSIRDGDELSNLFTERGVDEHSVLFFNSIYWIRVLPQIKRRFPMTRILLRSGGNDLLQARIEGAEERLEERQHFVARSIRDSVDTLIVNSAYSLERTRVLGIPRERMTIVQGGVDTARFAPQRPLERAALRKTLGLPLESTIVLAACRLERFKGLDTLLEAFREVRADTPVACVVVGDGPERERLAGLTHLLPARHEILFRHGVSHAQVSDYFRAADIYCHLPYEYEQTEPGGSYIHTETMGRSYLEAMAAGLPVIGTHVGGIPEITGQKEECALLVPQGNVSDAARAITTLAKNAALRTRLGVAGRKRAQRHFSWTEAVFPRYAELFSL